MIVSNLPSRISADTCRLHNHRNQQPWHAAFSGFLWRIFAMNWFGQFNLDFMGFLILAICGLAQSVQRDWFGVECLSVIWRHDIPPRLLVVLNGNYQWLYWHGFVRP